MRNKLANLILIVGCLALSIPLYAHHGNAAFDNGKLLSLKGTVTEWVWANPHCVLKFDAKDENNNVVHWSTELNNPPEMVRNGWTKQTLKSGDEVTVFLIQAKNGNAIGRVQKVVLADGQVLQAMPGIGAPPRQNNSDSPDAPKQ